MYGRVGWCHLRRVKSLVLERPVPDWPRRAEGPARGDDDRVFGFQRTLRIWYISFGRSRKRTSIYRRYPHLCEWYDTTKWSSFFRTHPKSTSAADVGRPLIRRHSPNRRPACIGTGGLTKGRKVWVRVGSTVETGLWLTSGLELERSVGSCPRVAGQGSGDWGEGGEEPPLGRGEGWDRWRTAADGCVAY